MVSQPFHEEPVAIRMRALATMGRHAEAVRAFADFRRTLGEELGLEPSPELAALEADILRHETSRRPTIGLPGNSFVGRELDFATVVSALSSARLVTLTGARRDRQDPPRLHAAPASRPFSRRHLHCGARRHRRGNAVAAADCNRTVPLRRPALDHIINFLRTRPLASGRGRLPRHLLDGSPHPASARPPRRTPDISNARHRQERLGAEGQHAVPVAPLPMPEWNDPPRRESRCPSIEP